MPTRRVGDCEAAVALYAALGCSSVEELCSYGLALYTMKRYDASAEQYERALTACADDTGDRSHIYAALGMVTYAASAASDVDATKNMLFEW